VEKSERNDAVNENAGVEKEYRLRQQSPEDGKIHWVAGISIRACNDEVLRRIDRCQSAFSIPRKSPDAIK